MTLPYVLFVVTKKFFQRFSWFVELRVPNNSKFVTKKAEFSAVSQAQPKEIFVNFFDAVTARSNALHLRFYYLYQQLLLINVFSPVKSNWAGIEILHHAWRLP